ncbi:MAG: transposase [Phycisphaeraceae bacterium]|nr:transposase [Phycisphaeraceae bacterium]
MSLNKTLALSTFMQEVKRDSSKWLHSTVPGMHAFHWQDGYFAFSIGESGAASLRQYIAGQKEHHASMDYKDEVRSLLRKYNLEWDERYIWT